MVHCVTCALADTEQQQQSTVGNDKGASPSANGNGSATAAANGAASSSSSSSSGTASFLLPVGSLAAIKNLRALCVSQQLLVIAGDKVSYTISLSTTVISSVIRLFSNFDVLNLHTQLACDVTGYVHVLVISVALSTQSYLHIQATNSSVVYSAQHAVGASPDASLQTMT
jgi:hypothetical protein